MDCTTYMRDHKLNDFIPNEKKIKMLSSFKVSLGVVIGLSFLIRLIHNRLGFQSEIRDKFGSGFLNVAMKSIKLATNIIEEFEFD